MQPDEDAPLRSQTVSVSKAYSFFFSVSDAKEWTAETPSYLLTDWHTSDGARLERAAARCLGLTALYEQKRKPLGNVPAPTHVLTPEKKTS